MKELRDTNALSEKAHAKLEPIFVTKNGYVDLVVMSIETFEHLTGTAQTDSAIRASEEDIASGADLMDAAEAFAALRRKHFG